MKHKPLKFVLRGVASTRKSIAYYIDSATRGYFADDVFFHASALSFQVFLCLIPTVFLLTWVLGIVLSRETLIRQLEIVSASALPRQVHSVDEIRRLFVSRAEVFTRHKSIYGAIGLIGFFWTSLGLVSTLRKSIFHILSIHLSQSFLRQTIYDLRVLLIAGFFLTGSTLVTALFATVREAALRLPFGYVRLVLVREVVPLLSGFGLTFLLCFSIYRFLSYGKLRSGPAAFGGVWAAALFELAKYVFAAYVTHVSELSRVYGTLEVIIGLLLWIFYSTTVFLLGVELSNAKSMRRLAT